MKTIALCLNLPDLEASGFEDKQLCKRYPGSGFAPYLLKYAHEKNVSLMPGSIALKAVKTGLLDAKNVIVIQEEMNESGMELVKCGADPAVLFCMESPIFSPFFYDAVPEMKEKFSHSLLFGGLGTEPLYFPSFDQDEIPEPLPWDSRVLACMVTSNKHYSRCPYEFRSSSSWRVATQNQLHDARIDVMATLLKAGGFDLYGKGWVPELAREIPPDEKVSTMQHYKFGICFENLSMLGYVTEKLIDCIVAGVIPVYMGAPDIADFVPPELYQIHEGPMQDIVEGMASVGDNNALDAIHAGQLFLRSPEGQRFSYQGFARRLLELCLGV